MMLFTINASYKIRRYYQWDARGVNTISSDAMVSRVLRCTPYEILLYGGAKYPFGILVGFTGNGFSFWTLQISFWKSVVY